MPRPRYSSIFAAILTIIMAVSVWACGADESDGYSADRADSYQIAESIADESEYEYKEPAPQSAAAKPAAAPQSAAPEWVVSADEDKKTSETAAAPVSKSLSDGFDLGAVQASLVQQERVIIRTVDMTIEVSSVADSVDSIAAVAVDLGGWLVNSDRSSRHFGKVSIRVPAQSLDEAVMRIREIGLDVEAETSTSRDVTEEYVDSQSRLTSLRATEDALLDLFDRAVDVEDALDVRTELAYLQAEIETTLGRIKLLEETAAFSLVHVSLKLSPAPMRVDAGEDRTLSAEQDARFNATFSPPAGIDEFYFTWDFGDGYPAVDGIRTAATTDPDNRITATVSHIYEDDLDSPYIVRFEITGTGEAGLAEGSGEFAVTVKEIPQIEVFAGSYEIAEEGEHVVFSGSFTRPVELDNFRAEWDFGDGSAPSIIIPEEGVTQVSASHAYENHRPSDYIATFTVTADSDAGEVSQSAEASVYVTESRGLVVGGWSASEQIKTATRALSVLAQSFGTLLIWVAILSPAIAIAIGALYGVIRISKWLGRGKPSLLSGGIRRRDTVQTVDASSETDSESRKE